MHSVDTRIDKNSQRLFFETMEPSRCTKNILSTETPQVWCASFSEHKDNIGTFQNLLSLKENFRARSLIHRHDRERVVLAYGLLRTLLAKYVDDMPADLEFTKNQFGKPVLSIEKYKSAPAFNVSHSGDFFTLVVATPNSKVGIDVEQHRSIPDLLEIAERFFHPDEVKELSLASHPNQAVMFFDCWTRKESIVKALGLGISMPFLSNFSVTTLPSTQPKLLSWLGRYDEVARWAMRELKMPENGYSATVAVREVSLQKVYCWRFIC